MNDPSELNIRDLMEHIVATHHAFCRQEIVRVGILFKEALASHGNKSDLKRMETLFSTLAKDLQMHLVKEEQTLFPYIARVEEAVQNNVPVSWPLFGTVQNPIRMMVLEHQQTGKELDEIRRLSNSYTLPPGDAPEPLIPLYDALRAFEQDMNQHIYFEDHLLFPRAVALEERACGNQ